MSRLSKFLLLFVVVVFALACSFVNQKVENVQNLASTAESVASMMPLATLQAIPSAMPDVATIMPGIETALPDFGDIKNPKDKPLSEWNGIPIMPAATVGAESAGMYSFKANVTIPDVVDYYKKEMVKLNWTEAFVIPDTGSGALMSYEKDNHMITITITAAEADTVLVILTYQ